MFYIFKNVSEVDGTNSYGIVPGDKIQEESKEFAFKVIEELPAAPQGDEFEGAEYILQYNELEDRFFWQLP